MENVFEYARKSVEENTEKRLSLPVRRLILSMLGKYEAATERKIFTKGKKLRAMLAMSCVKKIMPLWHLAFPGDDHYDKSIAQVESYIDTDCDSSHDEAAKRINQIIDELFYEIDNMCAIRPELYSFVLLCGTLMHTAIVALYDEEIIAPVYECAEDEDMDSFSWDAAYTACMLYESSFGQKDAVKLYFRHSFWKWYINEAERLYKEFCV